MSTSVTAPVTRRSGLPGRGTVVGEATVRALSGRATDPLADIGSSTPTGLTSPISPVGSTTQVSKGSWKS